MKQVMSMLIKRNN